MSTCDKLTGTLTLGATMSGGLLVAKGDKGDKGDSYIITESDKQEIKEALSADISELKSDLDHIINLETNIIGNRERVTPQWESGVYNGTNGAKEEDTGAIRFKDKVSAKVGDTIEYNRSQSGYLSYSCLIAKYVNDVFVSPLITLSAGNIYTFQEECEFAIYVNLQNDKTAEESIPVAEESFTAMVTKVLSYPIVESVNNNTSETAKKLNKNFGSDNSGKYLFVGSDGDVTLKEISENNNCFENHTNLFNIENTENGYLESNGNVNSSYTAHQTSEYIPVSPNTKYVFSVDCVIKKLYVIAEYTSKDKSGMIADKYVTNAQVGEFITGEDTKFVRIGIAKIFDNNAKLEISSPTKFTNYGEEYILLKERCQPEYQYAWANKRLLALGDSITASTTGWVSRIIEPLHISHAENVAVVNATMRDYEETPTYDGNPTSSSGYTNVIGNQVQKVLNNYENNVEGYEDFDIIIIAGGTNDVNYELYSEDIDTIDSQFFNGSSVIPVENADRKTFAGSMRYIYEKLNAIYPNAVFFFCTPLQRFDVPYKRTKATGDIIQLVADRLSVNSINVRECGILNTREQSGSRTDTADGLHPNDSGYAKMTGYISHAIVDYFTRFNIL